MRDGRTLTFRALRWDEQDVQIRASGGVQRLGLGEIAEVHLPAEEAWRRYFRELALLAPRADARLVRLETAGGLVVTASAERFRFLETSKEEGAEKGRHVVQPAWCRRPLWVRSTTIRNWDQRELVVPNKEFITGRLLNWTLSDPMARIVIPVGIAYGSDVGLALKLVHDAAEENEHVLDEPGPLVTFEAFGDNALTLMMRCYIDSMDQRLMTQSELNTAINQKFEDAGIVIAFPQRDIHLDTTKPLDLRIHQLQPES